MEKDFHHEPKPTDGFSAGEKVKAIIPGTAEHRAKEANEDRLEDKTMDKDYHHEPKPTDGFTSAEKAKSVIPGTAEYRAKEAAQERLDGQLPHSIIQETGNPQGMPIV